MKPGAICFDATGTLIETARPVGAVYHEMALAYGVDVMASTLRALHLNCTMAPGGLLPMRRCASWQPQQQVTSDKRVLVQVRSLRRASMRAI